MIWKSFWAFSLFLPIILLILWRWFFRKRIESAIGFSLAGQWKNIYFGWRPQTVWVPLVLWFMAMALAVITLARPQLADTKVKKNIEGIDIFIVLDISDSMLIEDMEPINRLESAKETIKRFIKGRISDRIGLMVFAGESYTRVPLTLDYPLLLKNVDQVQPSTNIKMGTAIGVALANGVSRIRDSNAKSRVIIFLTDGENNTGTIDPDTAIEVAKGYGIKIYSIGIGKDGQAQLPVYVQDAFGRKIKQYRPMHSSVNEDLLGRMAKDTGGKFWRASTGNQLSDIFKSIDNLEKTKIETNQYTRYEEKYQGWLQWAIWFMVAALFGQVALWRKAP